MTPSRDFMLRGDAFPSRPFSARTRHLVTIKSHNMGRGRLCTKSWRAQIRLACADGAPLDAPPALHQQLDSILRRSFSVSRFVIRLEVTSLLRREVVF